MGEAVRLTGAAPTRTRAGAFADEYSETQIVAALDSLFINYPCTGRPAWRGGAFLELFFSNGYKTDKRSDMISIWEDYFDLFKDNMTHYLQNNGKRASLIADRKFPTHFRDVLSRTPETEWFDGRLYGYVDAQPGEPTHYAISGGGKWSLQPDRLSNIEAYFRAHWVLQNTSLVIRTVLKWCEMIRPVCGIAGLSTVRDFSSPAYSMSDSGMFPFLRRFPGMDYMDAPHFSFLSGGRRYLRGVNWLTIIDDDFVGRVGGLSAVRENLRMYDNIVVHEYGGGVIIQAGAIPELGDLNKGRGLSKYAAVSRLLKPLRFEDYDQGYFRVPDPLDEVNETLKWVRRFD